MAPSVALSIPYELSVSRKKDNLQSQVQQLVLQKGPFRNVTESSLLADIQKPTAEAEEEGGGSEKDLDSTTETVQATREKLFQTQAEYLQMSSFIQNSLLTAIDGISASLAAYSKYAATAMSPALQQVAPTGSIETKSIEPKAVSKLTMRRMNDIATVTRAQAFTLAAAKLADASTRLDTEAQHQSKYWEQLACLRSNGWPVSRVPNDTRALVVHYGSAESSPQYRNRGIVALRQDENGDLSFAGHAETPKPRTLSITVHRRGKVTGRFNFGRGRPIGRSKLDDHLLQEREALFQEELFNEASKEARLLVNLGVKTRSSSIEIQISDECSMGLSYAKPVFGGPEESQIDDELADFVGSGLRLMLVAEHQHKYLQRAEHKPPPLSPLQRAAPEYALLRPVISSLRHHCEIAPLLEVLRKYEKSLQLAGLTLSFDHSPSNGSSTPTWALQALRRAVASQMVIALPSKRSISIKVETHLAAPRFGTQFNSMQYSSPCGTSFCAETASHKNFVRFLGDVLSRDICTLILQSENSSDHWQLHRKHPPQLVLADGNGKDPSTTLVVTCFDGRIAISYSNEKDSARECAKWNGQEVEVKGKNVHEEQTGKGLLEVVKSWTAKLIV